MKALQTANCKQMGLACSFERSAGVLLHAQPRESKVQDGTCLFWQSHFFQINA